MERKIRIPCLWKWRRNHWIQIGRFCRIANNFSHRKSSSLQKVILPKKWILILIKQVVTASLEWKFIEWNKKYKNSEERRKSFAIHKHYFPQWVCNLKIVGIYLFLSQIVTLKECFKILWVLPSNIGLPWSKYPTKQSLWT